MLREEKVKKHHYSLKEMTISIKQVVVSGNSFKAVEKNREIEIREKTEEIEEIKVGESRSISSKKNK